MSKLAGWTLVIYAIIVTGVAAYECAMIGYLESMLRELLRGVPN